jgi:molybdopterin-guanine dinucleotide biosynthesis protein A
MQPNLDVTGILLVGGRSSRMGRDKAFLPFRGAPIFETVLNTLKRHVETVILAGDRPERFETHGLAVLPDMYPGSALGGLFTGLHAAMTPYAFVAPCDLPFADDGILAYLLSLRKGFDVVVPSMEGRFEPLFAVYSRNCLEPMRDLLEARNFRIFDFYPRVRVRRVDEAELAAVSDPRRAFRNVNTATEYAKLLEEPENDR